MRGYEAAGGAKVDLARVTYWEAFGSLFVLGFVGTGLAVIPWLTMVSVIAPIVVGAILGNLDDDIRQFFGSHEPIIVPFMAFTLGQTINLASVITAGLPGIALGLAALVITGTGSMGGQTGTSTPVRVRFSPEDVRGGLYYFSPTITGIKRVPLGASQPVDFITAGNGTGCAGCHAVSRDGRQVAAKVGLAEIPPLLQAARKEQALRLLGTQPIAFREKTDLVFHRRESLPFHANGMRFEAFDEAGVPLAERSYYSVGGGFVVSDEVAADGSRQKVVAPDTTVLPHPFHSGAELLALSIREGCSIAELMRRNERHWRSDAEIDAGLLRIWAVMQSCVKRGCETGGTLPGGFQVRRRAQELHRQLCANPEAALRDPLQVLDWVNLYALAVNEENAAGGRVVTAPTNGAAGVIPAVLAYNAFSRANRLLLTELDGFAHDLFAFMSTGNRNEAPNAANLTALQPQAEAA